LIREGGRDREFMVIVDGEVNVTRMGRRLRSLGPGEWVGEIALLCAVPRTATVIAAAPTTLLVISAGGFRKLLRETPSIGTKIMATLGERLSDRAV
jgi:CRP-like cAMP-binding protein